MAFEHEKHLTLFGHCRESNSQSSSPYSSHYIDWATSIPETLHLMPKNQVVNVREGHEVKPPCFLKPLYYMEVIGHFYASQDLIPTNCHIGERKGSLSSVCVQ
jgi:hypothetical protein